MNRRNFGTMLGLFGLGASVKAEPPKTGKKGIIVCYCDVGSLPPYKALALTERLREEWFKDIDKEFPDWKLIMVPTRTEKTRIEYLPLNGNLPDEDSKKLLNLLEKSS